MESNKTGEYPCSRCQRIMNPHIYIVRVRESHDVCIQCRDEIDEFVKTNLVRTSADLSDLKESEII